MDEVVASVAIVRFLIKEELFGSAWIVCGPLLSRAKGLAHAHPELNDLHCNALALCGDALKGKGEKKRAALYYRLAVKQKGLCRDEAAAAAVAARDSATTPHLDFISWQTPFFEDAALKYKNCQCLMDSGESVVAIADLESIPHFARSAAMNITLGNAYERSGLKRNAIDAFKQALSVCPLALEAVVPLLRLEVSRSEIWEKITADSSHADKLPWLSYWFHGTAEAVIGTLGGLEYWTAMERQYPDCHMTLLGLGEGYVAREQWLDAEFVFDQARRMDSASLDSMDIYASVLKRQENTSGLHRLAQELVAVDMKRPEAWVAVSLYSEARGDRDRALEFADKAIELDSKYSLGYTLKGSLLMSSGKPEQAVTCFFQAHAIRKDIYSYRGLVDAYLACKKYREAAFAAKEAYRSMPKSAHALTLYGRVLCSFGGDETAAAGRAKKDRIDKAQKVFREALRLDPGASEATLALVDLYFHSAQYQECSKLLLTTIEKHGLDTAGDDLLHAKLGQVHIATGNLDEAMGCFLRAVSLNPDNVEAVQGIEQVEELMQEDPVDGMAVS